MDIAIESIVACLNIPPGVSLMLSSRCFFFDNYIIRYFIAKIQKEYGFFAVFAIHHTACNYIDVALILRITLFGWRCTVVRINTG